MATKNTTTSTDKTTTPKAADKAAAANPFADLFGNNPFGTTFGSDAWSTLIDRQIGFIQSVGAELQDLETRTLDQANRAMDEQARLSRESMLWGFKLTRQWHDLALHTANAAKPVAIA